MTYIKPSLVVTSVIILALGTVALWREHQRQWFEAGDCVQLGRLTVVGCDDPAASVIVLGVAEDGTERATCEAWPKSHIDLRMRAPGGRRYSPA